MNYHCLSTINDIKNQRLKLTKVIKIIMKLKKLKTYLKIIKLK